MWLKVGRFSADKACMPWLTHRVFTDLAVWMVSLGVFTGAIFPLFVIPLGVSTDTALRPSFFAASCTAGLFVGGLNFLLARVVVGRRLRVLAGGMTTVTERLRDADADAERASLGSEAEYSRSEVDSEDDLGESAAAFNLLAAAPTQSHRSRTTSAMTDSLTGLANRAAFHERLTAEVKRARRHRRPLSLAILDVDHFKRINDNHGHDVGDQVLIASAHRLTAITRSGELIARLGGEEFAWLLPEASGAHAWEAAERVRKAFSSQRFPIVGRVTLSVGVCDVEQAADADELYRLADKALDAAKKQGRNACVLYEAAVAADLSVAKR